MTKASISNSTYPLLFLQYIRDLRRIRRFVLLSVAKTIATALVSSRLDYCNSLLYNTANKDIARLQRVQNCLARVVTRSPRFSSSVPLLKSLHWLPANYRIIFKICTISYLALASKQPTYLNSRTVLRLCNCLTPWFCRATELDLRGYWRIRSHYYYYYHTILTLN